MVSLRNMVEMRIFVMMMLTISNVVVANVLELGASEVHGKEDRPEAMTLVSPAKVDEGDILIESRVSTDLIQQEISRDIFSLSVSD